MTERTCGDCQACCTYLPVSEVGSEALKDCPHQCASGCSIYEDRPEVCKGYSCAWRYGLGAEQDRPDKTGMLIDNLLRINGALQAKPMHEGAWEDVKAKRAVHRMSRQSRLPVLVAGYPETHIVEVVGRGVQ